MSEHQLGVLGDVRGLDVVELGCGTAYFSAWLARRGARPTGVDVTSAQLESARRYQDRFGITFPLVEDERPRLKAILERCPDLQAASDLVRAFAAMMSQLTGQQLPQWITGARAAELPGLSSFARGLEQDLDAVTLGLTTPWNSGPVEGRVNHIKMIKRQMFGRAGLPLLRKRVLLTARN